MEALTVQPPCVVSHVPSTLAPRHGLLATTRTAKTISSDHQQAEELVTATISKLQSLSQRPSASYRACHSDHQQATQLVTATISKLQSLSQRQSASYRACHSNNQQATELVNELKYKMFSSPFIPIRYRFIFSCSKCYVILRCAANTVFPLCYKTRPFCVTHLL